MRLGTRRFMWIGLVLLLVWNWAKGANLYDKRMIITRFSWESDKRGSVRGTWQTRRANRLRYGHNARTMDCMLSGCSGLFLSYRNYWSLVFRWTLLFKFVWCRLTVCKFFLAFNFCTFCHVPSVSRPSRAFPFIPVQSLLFFHVPVIFRPLIITFRTSLRYSFTFPF